MLEEMWYRYQPDTLPIITENEMIASIIKKDTSGVLQNLVDTALQHVKTTTTSQEVKEIVSRTDIQIQINSHITVQEQKQLQSYLLQNSAKIHGIQAENTTAAKIKEQLLPEESKSIDVDDNYYELDVLKTNHYTYKIVGRIDRVEHDHKSGASTLIEIKNRLHKLFYKVKEYEYLQMQTYLLLTGLQHAKLVEQWNNDVNTIEITKNQSYIDHVIFPELLEFIHRLDDILTNPISRTEYLNRKSLIEGHISTSPHDDELRCFAL